MNDHPTIVKRESQRLIAKASRPVGGYIHFIESVGTDANGQRWRFYSERVFDDNGVGRITEPYGFVRL